MFHFWIAKRNSAQTLKTRVDHRQERRRPRRRLETKIDFGGQSMEIRGHSQITAEIWPLLQRLTFEGQHGLKNKCRHWSRRGRQEVSQRTTQKIHFIKLIGKLNWNHQESISRLRNYSPLTRRQQRIDEEYLMHVIHQLLK